jgi:hypothetical protein
METVLLGGLLFGAIDNCTYTAHTHVTFLGNNIIKCVDAEGAGRCQARCSADFECTGFGLYVNSSKKGRCCTKSSNLNQANWSVGTSFTKDNLGCTTNPWPEKVEHSTMFVGNSSFNYNKGAMLESLPGGRMVGAMQAGAKEASGDQRILVGLSSDAGHSWGDFHMIDPQPSSKLAQWEPVLFFDAELSTLWLFYSEGPVALFAKTSMDGGNSWSDRRLILNATEKGRARVWPINRVVVMSIRNTTRWILPCDWGCSSTSAAFALISIDGGRHWSPGADLIVAPGQNLCPEPAMVAVNGSAHGVNTGTNVSTNGALLAIIRGPSVGLLQAVSHDGGDTWTLPADSGVPGASSKPALALLPSAEGQVGRRILLSYNLETRVPMVLSVSEDGGGSWKNFAMLDNGAGIKSDCYPTTIVLPTETVTAYSVYRGGPASTHMQSTDTSAEIRISRTALPLAPTHPTPAAPTPPPPAAPTPRSRRRLFSLRVLRSNTARATASSAARTTASSAAKATASNTARSTASNFPAGLPSREALVQLGRRLQGGIVLPDQQPYANATAIQNSLIQKRPMAVVYAESNKDVAETVNTARAWGVGVAVRSGGHSYAGYCVSDNRSLTLDLSRMANVSTRIGQRNEADGTTTPTPDGSSTPTCEVSVQAGAKWMHVYEALGDQAFVVGGGCGTVGVGGYTLGGGVGYFSRMYGLAIDNVLSYQVMTAAGILVNATRSHNSDLFWALSGGGGGNFGVLVSVDFRCHVPPSRAVTVGSYVWSPLNVSQARAVLSFYAGWASSLPDAMTAYVAITPDVLAITFFFVGDQADAQKLTVSWHQFFASHAALSPTAVQPLKVSAC